MSGISFALETICKDDFRACGIPGCFVAVRALLLHRQDREGEQVCTQEGKPHPPEPEEDEEEDEEDGEDGAEPICRHQQAVHAFAASA